MLRARRIPAAAAACLAGALSAWADPALADPPWSGVLPSTRATDWSYAGLPATLPDGETTPNPWTPPTRTTACATIAPEGTASAPVAPTDINAALQTCPAGQVVLLQAGNYYFNDSIDLYCTTTSPCALQPVTLRGAGADQTQIYFSSGASFSFGGNQYAPNFPLAAAPALGATTVQLTAPNSDLTPGTVIGIGQCTTGASGTVSGGNGLACTATDGVSIYDNGGEFVCIDDGPFCSHGYLSAQTSAANAEAEEGQVQVVTVTAASGATLTVSPPIFLDDLSAANTLAAWNYHPTATGVGLEDVSLDFTASTAGNDFSMSGCDACWVKGVRLIAGVGATQAFTINGCAQYLIANNYLFGFNSGNYGFINGVAYGVSSGLVLNNVTEHLLGVAADTAATGEVWAYNYAAPGSGHYFFHTGGTSSNLIEGNHAQQLDDDQIHGTHDFTTVFRNRFEGEVADEYGDNAYTAPLVIGGGSRFENVIGNVLGSPGAQVGYVNAGAWPSGPVYELGPWGMTGGSGPALTDPTVQATAVLWGNYDTFNDAVQWNGSEVPSALTQWTGHQQILGTGDGTTTVFSGTLANMPCQNGDVILGDNDDVFFAYDDGDGGWNQYGVADGTSTEPVTAGSIDCATGAISATFATAPSAGAQIYVNYLQQTQTSSPYQVPVPPQALPPSFFLPVSTAHPAGGTGLSWWKVCTNYPACSTFSTPPYPAIGPDVAGGPGPGGHTYAIPAELAYRSLPVDPAYEETVPVTGASWSGGQVTLTLGSVPPLAGEGEYQFLGGQFTVSGVTPAAYDGTFDVLTSSCATTCTLTYALASDPGSYASGGTFTWPLVRQFNEAVYTLDSPGGTAGASSGGASSTGGATAGGTSGSATSGGGPGTSGGSTGHSATAGGTTGNTAATSGGASSTSGGKGGASTTTGGAATTGPSTSAGAATASGGCGCTQGGSPGCVLLWLVALAFVSRRGTRSVARGRG
ncbi:MAG TPA: hypothetical protein VMB50_03730 [Myxococcales bacterium]|nr:hypothetical protein [Myxococcales bacterium]